MSVFTVNTNPTDSDLRAFGRAMLLGFGIIAAVLWGVYGHRLQPASYLSWHGATPQITAVSLWAVGALLFVISYASPAIAKPVYIVWMTVATKIGIVMSTIMLTVLFFVLVPFFAIIVKSGDPLRKKLHAGGTYWEDYTVHEPTIDRLKRPF